MMTRRQTFLAYSRRQPAAGITTGPAARHRDRGLVHAKAYLAFALFVFFVGEVPPIAAYEPAGGLVAITRAVTLAMAFIFLQLCVSRERLSDVVRVLPYLVPFAAFLLYAGVSVIWSLEPGLTVNRTIESCATVLFSGLWCYAAAWVFTSERELCRWIAFVVVGFALYGLSINVAVYGNPIELALNREESTRQRLVFGGIHPLTLGDIMAIGAIATVMSDIRPLWRASILLMLLTLLQLTDATGARILFILIIGFYLFVRAIRSRHATLWLMLLGLGVLATGALALLSEGETIDRLLENERLLGLTGRRALWAAIWQSGLASTWLGTGFDAARSAIEEVFGVAFQAHNQYLGVLVELGYAGVFLFAAVFLIWATVVIRSGSVLVWCLALYVVGINMNNASMFSKRSIIFLMILCYMGALFRVGAVQRRLSPTSKPTAHPPRRPGWSGDRRLAARTCELQP